MAKVIVPISSHRSNVVRGRVHRVSVSVNMVPMPIIAMLMSSPNRRECLVERPEANTLTLLSTQLIGEPEVNALENAR